MICIKYCIISVLKKYDVETIEKIISITVTIFHNIDEFYSVHIRVTSCHLLTTENKEHQLLARRKILAFKAT